MFPDAEVECREKRETRRYILNKVVCDRQRDAKICRSLPWYTIPTRIFVKQFTIPCFRSRCMTGSDQECQMVPKERCVDKCSTNPACGKCDQLRQDGVLQGGCPGGPPIQGGPMGPAPLPVPAATSCGNFYPKDLVGSFSPNPTNRGTYSSATPNTIYPQSSQNFVPANTLPQGMGSRTGSLPEIGDRSI